MNKHSLLMLAMGLVILPSAEAQDQYQITAIGTGLYANAINNSGEVCGNSSSGNPSGYVWNASTGFQNIGTLGGPSTQALGINNVGQVVGVSLTGNTFHAFVWSSSTGMQDMGTYVPSLSFGEGINDSGIAAISSENNLQNGYIWSSLTGALPLPDPYGEDYARAINNAGQVAGSVQLSGADTQACVWTNGILKTLGVLGSSSSYESSAAQAINDNGQVVGYSSTNSHEYNQDAFLWSQSTGMQDLGQIDSEFTIALGINDSGQVVGSGQSEEGAYNKGFVYENGKIYDLDSLLNASSSGWTITSATSINASGQIVGEGIFDGKSVAFLATPQAVPEPPVFAVLGIGMVSLIRLRGKRR